MLSRGGRASIGKSIFMYNWISIFYSLLYRTNQPISVKLSMLSKNYYTPHNEVRGVYWNLSVCLSVPSVCLAVHLSVSVHRHKFVPPTPPRFMHGFWWNFAHMLYMIWSCVSQNAIMFCYFFSRVMALDISKWKIVHVHYSLSLKWLVFCIDMYYRIL